MHALFVTLSEPRAGFEYRHAARENLGVEYLLSSVRAAGHEAESLNQNLPGEHDLGELDFSAYSLIGFSLPFWQYRTHYAEAINRLRIPERLLLVAGGHAATVGAAYFLRRCPRLDGVVMGEGEVTTRELLNGDKPSAQVAGFYTRQGFARRTVADVDAIALPARDELARSTARGTPSVEAYIVSTRGCVFRCSYCSVPTFYRAAHGCSWRQRSLSNVCREIDEVLDFFPSAQMLSFADDNFLGHLPDHRSRGIAIAQHIFSRQPRVLFEIACRADSVDHETFSRLADLGLCGVYLGIESGVQRLLDVFRKRTTVEENLRSIEVLSRIGVGCDVGFIMFSGTITLGEVRENLLFLRRIVAGFPIFVHPAAVFRSLLAYPHDLGQRAAQEDGGDLEPLRQEIDVLRLALEAVWQTKYERNFLGLEELASREPSGERGTPEAMRRTTLHMIEVALEMVRELEKCPAPSTSALVRRICGEVEVPQ